MILVIEDDAGLNLLVSDALRDEGWEVASAADGREALACLKRRRPALILLDYSLPDMKGRHFLDEAAPVPPFIVFTGAGDERIAADMMKRGARDYLVKDATFLDILPLTIRKVLDQIETERRLAQAQQALRESEERYRRFFEDAVLGIFQTTPAGRIVAANPAFARMHGYDSPAEIMSQVTDVGALYADPTIRPGVLQKILNSRTPLHIENCFRRKDGTTFIGNLHAWPVWDEQGTLRYLEGFIEDVTEHKRLEEERLEMERRLLRTQKLESLGILAGGIAHDFNNLLTAVLGNLDLGLRDLSPASPARPSFEYAVQAVRKAADLTRQMLAYSGKGRFVVRNLNLSALVEENADLLRTSIPRTVTLSLRMQPDLPPIAADAAQMQQIVMNLITNAAEAIDAGSGVVSLTTSVRDCDAAYLSHSRLENKPAPGRFVCLEVADNGCGMDEETQQRLFDPFYTTKAMGRGLGMSAVLGIVRGHRGAIFVDSETRKGATIRVMLPAAEPASEQPASPPHAIVSASGQAAAVSRGTALVVDDEPSVRELCRRLVERLGFTTLTAGDGQEAVEVFRRHADEVDLVLLDLSMPRLDGLAAFREMRCVKPTARVILSSGFDEQEATQRFEGEGLAGFVQKPYLLEDVETAIERAMDGR